MPEDFESPSKPTEPSKSLPFVSRQERRQRLKDEYQSQREIVPEEKIAPEPEAKITNETPLVTAARKLPGAFERVESSPGIKFEPTLENMPWVQAWLNEPKAELSVNLAKITLRGTKEQFYFGSFIRGDELFKAAEQLDSHRKQIADALFYAHIPDIIKQGYSHNAKLIDHNNSDQPIFYFGNKSGQRVYFMRFQLNNIPVIIRVAVCDKADQLKVLGQLTTDSHKRLKHIGKL